MKRLFIICVMLIFLSFNVKAENEGNNLNNENKTSIALGDWRQGIYNRDVNENLLMVNVEVIPVITEAFKNTTPWAAGFTAGFEHKMRPSTISSRFSFGLGAHLGVTRYFGKDIETPTIGTELNQTWDKYKSYTDIPLLIDFNFYYNLRRSNIFIGCAAGVNFMLGERDAALNSIGPSPRTDLEEAYSSAFGKDVTIISIQKDANNVSLNHVIPTFRFQLGYMYELSTNWRIRALVGAEYQMKYSDEYSGFRVDANYIELYHDHDSPASLNPFIAVGLSYSL